MHEVLVNRLGGLSLPRKSVVRLTDRPDMTLDVYRGRITTMQCIYVCGDTETSRNKMLKTKSIHTYPHKSYLPIVDKSKLECSSLLHMRRNKFCFVQKSP